MNYEIFAAYKLRVYELSNLGEINTNFRHLMQ